MLSQLDAITTLDLVREIVRQEMSLQDQQIWVYGQQLIIPPGKGLYVAVEYKYSKTYSNRNLTPVVDGSISEEQNLNAQEFITVQLFSRNFEALRRKEEAAMALKSVYAQQLQEKYAFRLSVNPQILDLSALEASAMLYRYDIPVVVLTAYQKTKAIVPFDTFAVEVEVNDGVPDMTAEFTQPTESLPT